MIGQVLAQSRLTSCVMISRAMRTSERQPSSVGKFWSRSTKTASTTPVYRENANRKKFSLIFAKDQNCGDVAELADDYLEIWQIPDSWVFNQIKARKLYLSPEIECELACHNITQQDLDKMLTDGKVLIDESFPYRTPNPLYFIQLDKNGVKWVFWVEIGQAKVRIKHILDITGIKLKKNEFLINKLFTQVKEADDCGCY